MRRTGAIGLALFLIASATSAAEVMPPTPAQHFNDYAKVTSTGIATRLNELLKEFERTNSSQVVVAVFTKMQSESSIEDYVHRLFQAWRIGQKEKNNGVLLAVFTENRKLRIEVGYGLEGALPDALAKRIIDNEITPQFKRGDYGAGLSAGVVAILAATKGEYKGTRRARGTSGPDGFLGTFIFNRFFPWHLIVGFVAFQVLLSILIRRRRRGTVYDGRGRRRYASGWDWLDGSGGSGGWSSGGGGGGFSGGGGSSGGGGASGSW